MSERGPENPGPSNPTREAVPQNGCIRFHPDQGDLDFEESVRSNALHDGNVSTQFKPWQGHYIPLYPRSGTGDGSIQAAVPPPSLSKNQDDQVAQPNSRYTPPYYTDTMPSAVSFRSQLNPEAQSFTVSPLRNKSFGIKQEPIDERGRELRNFSLGGPYQSRGLGDPPPDKVNRGVEPETKIKASVKTSPASQDSCLELSERMRSTTPDHVQIPMLEWLHFMRLKKGDEMLRERYPLVKNEIDIDIEIWERTRVMRAELGMNDF